MPRPPTRWPAGRAAPALVRGSADPVWHAVRAACRRARARRRSRGHPAGAPSSATCRHNPASAAFDVSYAGIRVPATMPAIDEIRTIAPPSSSTGSAARHTRKWLRTLTPNTSSHCSTVVSAKPRPRPMPTLHTTPSRPPSASHASCTKRVHAASSSTSPRSTVAAPPASRTKRAVSRAAASSRSAHATAAPSRAASTHIARPFPVVASSSLDGRVPRRQRERVCVRDARPPQECTFAAMRTSILTNVAPAFVTMAHSIVWCSAASVDPQNRPWSRVLHPLWEWDGTTLVGWVATSPTRLKREHFAHSPYMSFSYWSPEHDTCSAECRVEWKFDDVTRRAVWNKFKEAPPPVGMDPSDHSALAEPDRQPVRRVASRTLAPARVSRHRVLHGRPGGAGDGVGTRVRRRARRVRHDGPDLVGAPSAPGRHARRARAHLQKLRGRV